MYWVYALPNWLFGTLTVLAFCIFGLGGVAITRRWVPSLHHVDVPHNDIVGFFFGAVTVFYGITLGLLMVGVWGTFTAAEEKVDREAGTVAALYRDFSSYPKPTTRQITEIYPEYHRRNLAVTTKWHRPDGQQDAFGRVGSGPCNLRANVGRTEDLTYGIV
jgi:hypothetical protein